MASSITLDNEIQGLIDLISNTTDAYTTALFVAPAAGEPLRLLAYQSLSSNINTDVRIAPGEGLVGWAFKNQKAVNVDKFDQDTRRLLFYRSDEDIKSFMAVPLPNVNGVLAVDSKQRYVFTEKSQKILHQFGTVLEMALERLRLAGHGLRRAGVMAFLKDLDEVLARKEKDTDSFRRAMALIRAFAGADACLLTVVLPGNREFFFVSAVDAADSFEPPEEPYSLNKGLAGWVMREKRPLILPKARLGTDKSYVYNPAEPLKDHTSFAGLPVTWGRRLLGALCLTAAETLNLDDIKSVALEMAAQRLAASLEKEFLVKRVAELGRLDPQVGLPHRTYFTERLAVLLQRSPMTKGTVSLFLLRLANLDDMACEFGQEAAQEVLKNAARECLSRSNKDSELGHVSYGIIGIAEAGRTEKSGHNFSEDLALSLSDYVMEATEGRFRLKVDSVLVTPSMNIRRAEDLIRLGLNKLQGSL